MPSALLSWRLLFPLRAQESCQKQLGICQSLMLAKNMSAYLLHTDLGSRKMWYGGTAVILALALISLLWQPLSQRRFPTTVPVEDVLWTATPDYKIFFGPGTPPSLELAAKLRSLKTNYGLSDDIFRFPNTPIFIFPRILMAGGSANGIVLLSPLTAESAAFIHSDYLRAQKTTNR